MTYIHHSMTDREVIRSCSGIESHINRVLRDRLERRLDHADQLEKRCQTFIASLPVDPTIAGVERAFAESLNFIAELRDSVKIWPDD